MNRANLKFRWGSLIFFLLLTVVLVLVSHSWLLAVLGLLCVAAQLFALRGALRFHGSASGRRSHQ